MQCRQKKRYIYIETYTHKERDIYILMYVVYICKKCIQYIYTSIKYIYIIGLECVQFVCNLYAVYAEFL